MKYSVEELGFILYNNRSVKGVVNNFIPDINPLRLMKVERELSESKKIFTNDNRNVEINLEFIEQDADDVNVTKEELEELTDLFLDIIGKFDDNEYDYLWRRGIWDRAIREYNIFGLSQIKDKRHLEIIGATCHPTLKHILIDGVESGGIVIPLFENGKLVNCSIRKIAIENLEKKKSLKYSLACPDIPVWGLDNIEKGDEIWLTEGIFDMMALHRLNQKCVSCSSAMWSGIQLYKVLRKKPSKINIFSDNDQVGLRTSGILQNFFEKNNIECDVYISKNYKDAADHYFQNNKGLYHTEKVNIDEKMIIENTDESFDFLNHLKNRKY